MDKQSISPQIRILEVIITKGGTANTREIADMTGMNRNNVNRNTFHLVNRSLLRKTYGTIKTSRGASRIKIFTIRTQKYDKITKMIRNAHND